MKTFFIIFFVIGFSEAVISPTTRHKFKPSTTPSPHISPKSEDPEGYVEKDNGKIRQCTCAESEACVTEAYENHYQTCRESCQSHLSYLGNDTDKYVACFDTPKTGATVMNTCLKKHNKNFCNPHDVSDIFISNPVYDADVTAVLKSDIPLVKHLKEFHMCSGDCLKKHILECYEKKACGTKLDENHDLGKIGLFCPILKANVYTATVNAVVCFGPVKL